MTPGGIDVQELVVKLDAVSNALATVDANIGHIAKGLIEIEDIARTCKQGMEPACLLLIANIARSLR